MNKCVELKYCYAKDAMYTKRYHIYTDNRLIITHRFYIGIDNIVSTRPATIGAQISNFQNIYSLQNSLGKGIFKIKTHSH